MPGSASVDVTRNTAALAGRLDRTAGRLFGTARAGGGNGERPGRFRPTPVSRVASQRRSCWRRSCRGVDTTITNVALPHAGSLSASQDQIAWVVTSYIVAAAIGGAATGWLAGLRHQIRIPHFGDRLHRGLGAVRRRHGLTQLVIYPVAARRARRSPGRRKAVLFQINPERHAQAMAVWGMGGDLGDHRPSARRLSDRLLQLALGCSSSSAVRRARAPSASCFHSPNAAHREAFDFFGFTRSASRSARCRCCSTAAS